MGALPLLVSSPFAGCPIIQCFSFLKGKRGKRQILLFWFVSAQCSNPSPKNELVSTCENWLPWINPCSSSDHSLLSCLTWDKTFCRCSRQKVKAWNVAKDLHCNFLFSCCLDSLTAARLSGKEKRNKMPQITMCFGLMPHPYLSRSVCLFLSIPSPSSSSHPLTITQEVWSSWKQVSEHGKGQGQGGQVRVGAQRMFLSFHCPSGYCKPQCSPSWGSQALVTLVRPWAHTCSLVGPVWRSNCSAGVIPPNKRCFLKIIKALTSRKKSATITADDQM